MGKWTVIIEEIERLWAEPTVVHIHVGDRKGNIYMVHRLYAAADTVIECYESNEDLGCESTTVNDSAPIDFVAQVVKEILEWHINRGTEFFATIDVNNNRLKEKIEKVVEGLKGK